MQIFARILSGLKYLTGPSLAALCAIFTLSPFQNCAPIHDRATWSQANSESTFKNSCQIDSLSKYRASLLTKTELVYVIKDLFPDQIESDTNHKILLALSQIPEITSSMTADHSNFAENNSGKVPSSIYLSHIADAAELLFIEYQKDNLFSQDCSAERDSIACLNHLRAKIFERLWRRPLIEEEYQLLLEVFSGELSFDEKVKVAFLIAFLSPQFYLKNYLPLKGANTVVHYSQYFLASRIAFFIYNSVPDRDLLEAAKKGELDSQYAIAAHVRRLLSNPELVDRFVTHTLSHWLGIDEDLNASGELSNDLGAKVRTRDLAQANFLALKDMVRENKNLPSFFNLEEIYLNQSIAQYMGFDASTLANIGLAQTSSPYEFKKVQVKALEGPYGNYFLSPHFASKTQSALSGGLKTLISRRGKYVAEKFLCMTIPPNELDPADVTRVLGPNPDLLTQIHVGEIRSNHESCKMCHGVVDRFGMGLEFVGPFGRPRSQYADGTAIKVNFKLKEEDQNSVISFEQFLDTAVKDSRLHACFIKTLASKVAPMMATDQMPCVQTLTPKSQTLGIVDLVAEIISSPLFQKALK